MLIVLYVLIIRRQLSILFKLEQWTLSSLSDRFHLKFNAFWLIQFQNLSQQYFRHGRDPPNFAGQLRRCFSQPHRKFLKFNGSPALQLLDRLISALLLKMNFLIYSTIFHLCVWLSLPKLFARFPHLAICFDVWSLHCRLHSFASRWEFHELLWKPLRLHGYFLHLYLFYRHSWFKKVRLAQLRY